MLFTSTFTVPAATPAAAPHTEELVVAHGIIHQVEVAFLDGPEDEVNVVVRRALRQLVPTNPEASVVGNDTTVRAILSEPIEEPPYLLHIDSWSPNSTYGHEVTVRVHILPREVLMPEIPEMGVLRRIGRTLFGGG